MVQTQLDMGLYVALDATAGGHLWKLPELHAVVKHPKLRHKRYSWCSLGAKDPITRGLATAASAHGLGTAALVGGEPNALPNCALAYALSGIISSVLVAIPVVQVALMSIIGAA